MSFPISETERRRLVVLDFVLTAVAGDVDAFTRNLVAIDWPGAWLDIFTELEPVGWVHPDIKPSFLFAWRGGADWITNPPIGIDWTMTKDLDEHRDLLVRSIKILLQQSKGERVPHALYRGQSLAEHEAGTYGVWWTPDPVYAEMFARSRIRQATGRRAVVALLNPCDAIICKLDSKEFLLDPSLIKDVRCIIEPPAYFPEEEDMPSKATAKLIGVPCGYWKDDVAAWVDQGMPIEGQRQWVEARLQKLAEETARA